MTTTALTTTQSQRQRSWFASPPGIFGLIALPVAAAFGLTWAWLGFAAIAPYLLSLPCAAMMAHCVMRAGGAGKAASPNVLSNLNLPQHGAASVDRPE